MAVNLGSYQKRDRTVPLSTAIPLVYGGAALIAVVILFKLIRK